MTSSLLGKACNKHQTLLLKRSLIAKEKRRCSQGEISIRVRSALERGTNQAEIFWGKSTEEPSGKNLGPHI